MKKQVASTWQPIETAPIGKKFIGLTRNGYPTEAYIPPKIAPCALDPGGDEVDLTHWIPFPSLPCETSCQI